MKPITSLITCDLIIFSMPLLLVGLGFFVPVVFPLAFISLVFIFFPGFLFYYILSKIEIYSVPNEGMHEVQCPLEKSKVIYLNKMNQNNNSIEALEA